MSEVKKYLIRINNYDHATCFSMNLTDEQYNIIKQLSDLSKINIIREGFSPILSIKEDK